MTTWYYKYTQWGLFTVTRIWEIKGPTIEQDIELEPNGDPLGTLLGLQIQQGKSIFLIPHPDSSRSCFNIYIKNLKTKGFDVEEVATLEQFHKFLEDRKSSIDSIFWAACDYLVPRGW